MGSQGLLFLCVSKEEAKKIKPLRMGSEVTFVIVTELRVEDQLTHVG